MNQTRIAELRKDRAWTQANLAAQSGVATRTIQRIESGHDASLDSLALIAQALGVSVQELFVRIDDDELGVAVGRIDGLQRELDAQRARKQKRRDMFRGALVILVALLVAVSICLFFVHKIAVG